MPTLKSSLFNIISHYPELPIAIAYSGGLDSQVLLDIVSVLKRENLITNQIMACHVNHGLSEHANAWASFAIKQCQLREVPLKVISVSLDLNSKESLEAQAREARYQAICSMNDVPMLILTGHHKDDQAETFLLALKRGAGVKGLGAMSVTSSLNEHILARPLLSLPRAELQRYAEEKQLEWVEDESNQDRVFDRNFIRHEILPKLKVRWPGIVDTISRSAQHCQQTQSLLDDMALLDMSQCACDDELALNISALQQLSVARFNNVVRYFINKQKGQMPSTSQLLEVRVQIDGEADKKPQIKVGNLWFRRYKGKLYLTEAFNDVSKFSVEVALVDGFNTKQGLKITLPDELGVIMFSGFEDDLLIDEGKIKSVQRITLNRKDKKIKVCFSHDNPKILPSYRQHHRSLKKVLQELNIPNWLRKRTPFIYVDGELAMVANQFVCQKYLPIENQSSIAIYWLNAE